MNRLANSKALSLEIFEELSLKSSCTKFLIMFANICNKLLHFAINKAKLNEGNINFEDTAPI